MLCPKNKPSEDYEHFALLLLFQLLLKDCCYLEQFWFVKSLIVREPFSPLVFSPGSISNKGGIAVNYPLAHACKRLVTNILSAIKPLS